MNTIAAGNRLPFMPVELWLQCMEVLSNRCLSRTMHLSKAWRLAALNPTLWQRIRAHGPHLQGLEVMLQRSNSLQLFLDIDLSMCQYSDLFPTLDLLIRNMPRTRVLELQRGLPSCNIVKGVRSYNVNEDSAQLGQSLIGLLTTSAPALQRLSLGLAFVSNDLVMPTHMPALRELHLDGQMMLHVEHLQNLHTLQLGPRCSVPQDKITLPSSLRVLEIDSKPHVFLFGQPLFIPQLAVAADASARHTIRLEVKTDMSWEDSSLVIGRAGYFELAALLELSYTNMSRGRQPEAFVSGVLADKGFRYKLKSIAIVSHEHIGLIFHGSLHRCTVHLTILLSHDAVYKTAILNTTERLSMIEYAPSPKGSNWFVPIPTTTLTTVQVFVIECGRGHNIKHCLSLFGTNALPDWTRIELPQLRELRLTRNSRALSRNLRVRARDVATFMSKHVQMNNDKLDRLVVEVGHGLWFEESRAEANEILSALTDQIVFE
ncbi:hypothetical protein BKA62DRAFT_111325 [Auriculariales sp. MPI-PUGE-AT-0066]|nr:hypothetical protein BKA62DRAFT_111325 [Auriculariales sp. MPI-PUGE-AT-0066]